MTLSDLVKPIIYRGYVCTLNGHAVRVVQLKMDGDRIARVLVTKPNPNTEGRTAVTNWYNWDSFVNRLPEGHRFRSEHPQVVFNVDGVH